MPLQRGNGRADKDWLCRCYVPVWRAVWVYTGGDQRTDDAVQAAFVKALEPERAGMPPINLIPWLVTVAVNWLRGEMRKSNREFSVDLIGRPVPDDSSTFDRPEQAAIRQDEQDGLMEAIRHLHEEQRDTVFCYYYLDLTYAEIARLLGVSIGTVKSRLSRAKASLRSHLAISEVTKDEDRATAQR